MAHKIKAPLKLRSTEIRGAFVCLAPSQDAPGNKLEQRHNPKRRYTPAAHKRRQKQQKGQKETRDTSDIAYLRMQRMYRAFISTLD